MFVENRFKLDDIITDPGNKVKIFGSNIKKPWHFFLNFSSTVNIQIFAINDFYFIL